MAAIAYIPKTLETSLTNELITTMYTCGYPPGEIHEPDPNLNSASSIKPMTNHWVLFCETSASGLIKIDPSPSGANMSIVVIVQKQENDFTNDAAIFYRLVTNFTFGAFLSTIKEENYDRYRFTSGGQGCRFWISSFLNSLMNKKLLVNKDEVDAAVKGLSAVWNRGNLVPQNQQTPLSEGIFY